MVVKNFGRSPDFRQLDESPGLAALVNAGGRVVDLPGLDAATMYEIDRFGSSFWAAVNSENAERALTPTARRRTQRWLNECYAALGKVEDLL